MSPELIDPQRFGFKNNRPTKASDCYALGMVVYETISGNLPFHKYADITVAMKVLEGEHPPRGTRFTTGLWKTLEQCWASHRTTARASKVFVGVWRRSQSCQSHLLRRWMRRWRIAVMIWTQKTVPLEP